MSDPRNIVLGPRKGPSAEDIKRQAEAMVAGLDMSKLGPPDHLDRLRAAVGAIHLCDYQTHKVEGTFKALTVDGEPAMVLAGRADLAALLSERDALAAVAEAARNLDSKPDHAVTDARALAALRDALAAYDRTVAKP